MGDCYDKGKYLMTLEITVYGQNDWALPFTKQQNVRLVNIESIYRQQINYFPEEKVSDWTKLKASADDKINVTEKIEICFWKCKNMVGKGENAGFQHFLLFSQCFQKVPISRSSKVWSVWEKIKGGLTDILFLIC